MVTVLRPITWLQPGWAVTLTDASKIGVPVQRSIESRVQVTLRRLGTGCSVTSTLMVQAEPATQPEMSTVTEEIPAAVGGGRFATDSVGAPGPLGAALWVVAWARGTAVTGVVTGTSP
jgi:hypothetical protein